MWRLIKLLTSFLFLIAASAYAQNVQQSGTVTANTVPYWVTNGVIGDSVTSADSPITSFGVTNNGGAGICVNSDRATAPGYNQLCFGAQTNGAATISLQNVGTATPQNLNFIINGVVVTIPVGAASIITGNPPFTAGHVPCFLSNAGILQDCGLTLTTGGVVTVGAWQGTPIAVGFGGTGATTQAGARANLGLGTMATQNANAVAITGGTITGMPTPTNASDVAIKSYVDSTAAGLNILAASALATTTTLPNSPTYANGSSGVGATLTAGSNTTLTVDGVSASLNTVVLVKNQSSAFQNGIYTVTTAGSGSAPWVLTRASYFDIAAQMKVGSYTFVTTGSVNANTSWTLQSTVVTVGTDALNFVQFSVSGNGTVTNVTIAAGLGISLSGTCVITTLGTCTVTNSGVTSVGGITGSATLGTGLIATGSTINTDAAPSNGLFVPILGSGSPFQGVMFCPYHGSLTLINGILQGIPAAACVISGGVQGIHNNACIENASFVTTCGQTLATNTLYYCYVYMNGTTMQMLFSTNAHTTDATYGNEVMSGDGTRSLVGIVFTDAAGLFEGTENIQYTESWFNRVHIAIVVSVVGPGFSNTSFAEQNSNNRLGWVQFSDEIPAFEAACTVLNNTAGQTTSVGIGIDSNVTPSFQIGVYQAPASNYQGNATTYTPGVPGVDGQHFASMLVHVSAGAGQVTQCAMHSTPLPS
jgi:hypothetical protein